MRKWKYLSEKAVPKGLGEFSSLNAGEHLQEVLDQRGEEGWELVAVITLAHDSFPTVIFKRPADE